MTPQYRATEFSFRSTPHVGVDTFSSSLTEHLRDHAKDNWGVQQIFHVRQERDDHGGFHQHFGVLWTRQMNPEIEAALHAETVRRLR